MRMERPGVVGACGLVRNLGALGAFSALLRRGGLLSRLSLCRRNAGLPSGTSLPRVSPAPRPSRGKRGDTDDATRPTALDMKPPEVFRWLRKRLSIPELTAMVRGAHEQGVVC